MRQVRKTACEVKKEKVMVKRIGQQHDVEINDSTFATSIAAESRQKHG